MSQLRPESGVKQTKSARYRTSYLKCRFDTTLRNLAESAAMQASTCAIGKIKLDELVGHIALLRVDTDAEVVHK